MRSNLFFIIVVFVQLHCHAFWFAHDRAISAAQKGNWNKATSLLTKEVIDFPNQADLLYDAGVVSYKSGDIKRAQAYFKRAAKHAIKDSQLEEQSLFNYGNSCVGQRKLKDAILAYERVIEINSENERAKHNLEVVKKMLEQQKQKEQSNKDQKQKNDGFSKQNKGERNKEKQQDDEQKKNQKEQEKVNNEQQKDEQCNEKEKEDSQDHEDCGSHIDNEKNRNNSNNSQNNLSKKEKEQTFSSENKREDQEKSKKDRQEHGQKKYEDENSECKKNTKNGNKNNSQEEPGGVKAHSEKEIKQEIKEEEKLESWLAQILDEHEEKDAAHQKYLIKSAVTKEMVGNEGQNCW